MSRTKVLLVFGGESPEHKVSIASARNVYGALDKTKYDVYLCYITRSGADWLLVQSFDDSGFELTPLLGQKAFMVGGEELSIDVIFPVLHGAHGEDGDIQGFARLMHIPCVGPSLIGAAITMDKDITKRLLRDGGVPVVDWLVWRTADRRPAYDTVRKTLGDTLFIKPSGAGSSVGVSKVKNQNMYDTALSLAAKFDDTVLIERSVDCREIEVAMLGNDQPEMAEPGEIVPGDEFYSYDAKYGVGSKSVVTIPVDLPQATADKIKVYARLAYSLTRGQGMARLDFFLTENGNIYLNEINSIPGFTNISMYPKLWQHAGVSYGQLLDRLIELALDV